MKIVHVIDNISAEKVFCGKNFRMVTGAENHGWSAAYFMSAYPRQQEIAWKWCEECLTSDDYALFVLGDLP